MESIDQSMPHTSNDLAENIGGITAWTDTYLQLYCIYAMMLVWCEIYNAYNIIHAENFQSGAVFVYIISTHAQKRRYKTQNSALVKKCFMRWKCIYQEIKKKIFRIYYTVHTPHSMRSYWACVCTTWKPFASDGKRKCENK